MPSPFRGSRVLITGGLGFIGSNLARRLVELEAEVLLVDSLVPECGGLVFNIADIQDKVTVERVDARDEACRHHNPDVRIVFASTRQIYGRPDYLPVDEKHPVRPVDVNGINKMAGESYHLLYHRVYGLRACALRLTNSIGPRMRVKDARQTFVGLWIRRLLQGEPIEVWDGEQRRDFTFVDDVVEAFLAAATNDAAVGRVFNVGGDGPISLHSLAELLIDVNQGGEYVVRSYPPEYKRIDIGDYYTDFSLIRSTLGWAPRILLRDALTRTLEFYREHLDHYL